MNVIKMNNGHVELRSSNGCLVRMIPTSTSNAIDADLNNDGLVVIARADGIVEVRKETGVLVRQISTSAAKVRISGDEIAITRTDGRLEIRNINGNLIRFI